MDGKNILVEYRYIEGNRDRIPSLVSELVQRNVDVLVSSSFTAVRAAKESTKTIPIVMVVTQDPVALGLIDSLAHPGGNITGVTRLTRKLSGKRLELLKEVVPKLSRVAVFGTSTTPSTAPMLKETRLAAGAFKVQLQYLDVLYSEDIETAFRSAGKESANAVLVLAGPMVFSQRTQIAKLAVKSRLPAIYPQTEFTEAGGLM